MISKKIVSLGLACALAVSPLSCNFAFANETVSESKVSTTNNENSKSTVDEETLNKIVEKLKKANKEEMEALAEKYEKKLKDLLVISAIRKVESERLARDLSELKSKLRTFFWYFLSFAGTSFILFSLLNTTSALFTSLIGATGLLAAIAGLCI